MIARYAVLSAAGLFALAPFALIAEGCPPPLPPVAPETGPLSADVSLPDASPEAASACAQLARLGCPEGTARTCAVALDKQASMGISLELTPRTLACLASAKTKLDVRACSKAVACP